VLAEFANRGWICRQGKSLLISDCESIARRARVPTPPGPYNTHRPAGTKHVHTPRPATVPIPYSSAKNHRASGRQPRLDRSNWTRKCSAPRHG
jgi:hypothetical protein